MKCQAPVLMFLKIVFFCGVFHVLKYCLLLRCVQPSVVIHSAAERRPDVVEKQVEATRSLNVSATQFVCQGAGRFTSAQYGM